MNELIKLNRIELETRYIRLIEALLEISKHSQYATHKCPELAKRALEQVGIQLPTDWNDEANRPKS